jgi:aryl-alcohol dehydrogenase-like predicted oxidoreductase
MHTRTLGNSDLKITPLGFGSWAVGGEWKFGWGPQSDADSVAAIHSALDHGMNWIDTAAVYGLGHSEEVVRKALEEWKGERPYLFTKCGMLWDEQGAIDYSLRSDSIRREVEQSLRRLGVETIDLYQIHWTADELEETLEGWAEMAKLKEEGKVRWIGVCNATVEEMTAMIAIAPITSLQPPYSLMRRDIEADQLPWCSEHGVGTIVYSPMGSGLLTGSMTHERVASFPEGDWRRNNPQFQEPKLTENLALADRLKTVGARHGRTAAEAALAWVLRRPEVTGAIVGVRQATQVKGLIHGAELKLSKEEIAEIEGGK